ncbi:RES family NAD+ phosphorylase [Arthrobacter sp. Sa2CUA1]|uniref:RES family NAD+ phosphorylase n=1 Tax=Arthrobacter gallicola TaxID=2762225 RepID=A0ABR8UQK6_9MICC|nr:RES family NAD+ phosphorylase [Arthrobacter gallicola]MBD7994652.1 RES family NAD+ phosphorylase [Arthrobacter gallicola]
MLAYRIFPYLPRAQPGEPGHPLYLHKPQSGGRLDNPGSYDLWYLAMTPAGAVAEVFGDQNQWTADMFDVPYLRGSRRALATLEIPDSINLLDLDNAQNLVDLRIKPSEVVTRNRAASQAWALRVFNQRNTAGAQQWAGVKWWSFHRPHWEIIGIWETPSRSAPLTLRNIERLDLNNMHVQDAMKSLAKTIV